MFIEKLELFLMQVKDVFMNINWITDILDILLVAVILYAIIKQLRKSQSIQVIKGIVFIALLYGAVKLIGMQTSAFMFSKLFSDIIIIFVVLFSTELRHALENLGKKKFGKNMFFNSSSSDEKEIEAINSVCRACGAMSRSRVGSLIVFQRQSLLGDLTKHAVTIDSETTFEMICSIFYPKAPLHDGAVVIKDGRIVAARCVVPMKNDRVVDDDIGTRHRAAMEVSFNSDAVAVVTSEETGIISLAVEGKLIRGLSDSELREKLGALLLSSKNQKGRRFSKKEKTDEIKEITAEDNEITESVNDVGEESVSAEIEAPFEVTEKDDENKIDNEGEGNNEQE
ncbi:MAG: TIGR00159 family protein [Ruminococcaceae bacterium]|nr:TIGR00159 family protein [Oscillospiraceae bacterium]MBR3597191.1 diadenylate cyclase CdaA [Clostridia bacterium]